jgi:hypothetical protein
MYDLHVFFIQIICVEKFLRTILVKQVKTENNFTSGNKMAYPERVGPFNCGEQSLFKLRSVEDESDMFNGKDLINSAVRVITI